MPSDARAMVQEFADKCLRCGLCAQTDCGNYGADTPCLGDICESLLSADETYRHFPFTCALCNRCTVKCPAGLVAIDACKPLRPLVMAQHPEIAPLYRKFRTDLKYNLFSSLRSRRSGDIDHIEYVTGEADLSDEANRTAFFPGCALDTYAPELCAKVSTWLRDEGVASRTLHFCCGATFFDTGFFDEFEDYRVRARRYLSELGITRLVYTCPHCGYELPQLFEDDGIELVILEQVMLDHGKTSDFAGRISFHDACYDRLTGIYGKLARELYPEATIVDMPHSGENSLCCGGGGMVSCYAPAYCEYRRNQRLAEIDAVDADFVTSTCFSCVNSLQRGDADKPMRHYLEPIFDASIDWPEVYASVDALYGDARYQELISQGNDIKTFD